MSHHRVGAKKNKWKCNRYRNKELKQKRRCNKYKNKSNQTIKSKGVKKHGQGYLFLETSTRRSSELTLSPMDTSLDELFKFRWTLGSLSMMPIIMHITSSTTIHQLYKHICVELNCKMHHFTLFRQTYDKTSDISVKHDLLMVADFNDPVYNHTRITKLVHTNLHFEWKPLTVYIQAFNRLVNIQSITYGNTMNDVFDAYSKLPISNINSSSRVVNYRLMDGQDCVFEKKAQSRRKRSFLLDWGFSYKYRGKLYSMNLPQTLFFRLECYVKICIPNKTTANIAIDCQTTIAHLKLQLCEKHNLHKYEFQIRSENSYLTSTNPIEDSTLICDMTESICFQWNNTNIYINETELCNVSFDSTIEDIKKQYNNKMNISYVSYELSYDDEELNDEKTLHHYKIQPNAQLKILFAIRIIIPHLPEWLLSVSPADTIGTIRSRICAKKNMSMDAFRLFTSFNINNQYLLDTMTLDEYGIENRLAVYLVFLINSVANAMFCGILNLSDPNCLNDEITLSVQTLEGSYVELDAIKVSYNVLQVKLLIEEQLRIYHKTQTLIYNGYELNDNLTMGKVVGSSECDEVLYVMVDGGTHLHDLLIDNIVSEIDELAELERVQTLVESTSRDDDVYVKIDSIYKVKQNYKQNEMIFNGLLSLKKNKKEAMLFHGSSLRIIKEIISNGFNRDYNKRHVYGKGVYFTNIAHISAWYSQQKSDEENEDLYVMLCCRTYIGDSTIGKHTMKEYELYKSDGVTQYDSFVNHLDNPQIFVINRDYHSVPSYLIVFSIHNTE